MKDVAKNVIAIKTQLLENINRMWNQHPQMQ